MLDFYLYFFRSAIRHSLYRFDHSRRESYIENYMISSQVDHLAYKSVISSICKLLL